MNVIKLITILTALLSIVSWTYRYFDEHVNGIKELLFYILVPVIAWGLFVGSLYLLKNNKILIKILSIILLIPFSALWVASIFVGFYGLKIH